MVTLTLILVIKETATSKALLPRIVTHKRSKVLYRALWFFTDRDKAFTVVHCHWIFIIAFFFIDAFHYLCSSILFEKYKNREIVCSQGHFTGTTLEFHIKVLSPTGILLFIKKIVIFHVQWHIWQKHHICFKKHFFKVKFKFDID